MIKVIPFEPEHLYGIEPFIPGDYIKSLCNNQEYLKGLKTLGPCYSGFDLEGNCVGAAGVRQINAKTFEGWVILAQNPKRNIKSILKSIDLFIVNMFEFNAADRFQITVDMNFKEGHRLAKLLGFKPEGILKNYEHGNDYMMYARLNTWL